jgi:hypothetical protein
MQKNLIKYLALLIALMCVFYFFKKIQVKDQSNVNEFIAEEIYDSSLPDDFHVFYDKYHTDSLFQLNRTMFPLKGLAKAIDSTKIAQEVIWQKDQWIMHKPFDSQNGTFERTFTNIGGIVTEKISANEGLFSLEKRYAKLGGDWYLIYYQELLMHG